MSAKEKKTVRVAASAGSPRVEAAMKRANKTARKAARARRLAEPSAEAEKLRKSAVARQSIPKLHLTRGQKKKYSELLTRLHEKINKQITFLATDSLNKVDNDEPRDDVTDDFDRDFALSLLTSEHDILFEISQAIQRLRDQTYGRCEQCGTAVGAARLEAIPFARLCISCQATAERDKSRYQPFGGTLAEAGKAAAGQSAGSQEE